MLLANPPVELQPTTPGIAQDGNLNITGRVLGGSLHASSSTSSAQVIFGTATSTTGNTFAGAFRSDSIAGVGVYGWATAATGTANGVRGQSFSSSGTGVFGWVTATSGFNYGVRGESASTSGTGVSGLATSATGLTNGLRGQSDSTTGKGVLGVASAAFGTNYGVYGRAISPSGYGVYAEGNMGCTGILTSPLAQFVGASLNQVLFAQNLSSAQDASGVKGISTAVSGNTLGGYFYSASNTGRGVYGYGGAVGVFGEGAIGVRGVSSGDGVYGTSSGTSGRAVYGEVTGTSGVGLWGLASAGSGNTYGVYGRSDSPTGHGMFGYASSGSGLAIGVQGHSNSTSGTGIWGESNAASGSNQGVYGLATSADGFGVYGHNPHGYGVYGTSNEKAGVFGKTTDLYDPGVYGECAPGGYGSGVTGWGVGQYMFGVLSIGTLSASGYKAFRIDHPLDPENKYLMHYATESPIPQNFYVGNVVTDAQGYAWVELPDYFEEINKNFKYQLTVLDDADSTGFVQVKVSKKIRGRHFQIRTSAPRTEVSWRVDADRNDLFNRRYPPQDVLDKPAREKGTYQHPELYDLGPERGMSYGATKAPPPEGKKSRESK